MVDCTNYLLHRHTAELPPAFRQSARIVLNQLLSHPDRTPIVLTNSLGDKVSRLRATLAIDGQVAVLGDTRQYDMDPGWTHHFPHPEFGRIQVWPVSQTHSIDLRRPAYYDALVRAAAGGSRLVVVADTLSLPGAVPLMMGIPFLLLRTAYTPEWCAKAVDVHPLGLVLDDLGELPSALDVLPT